MSLEEILDLLGKCKTDWEAWRLLHTIHLIVQRDPRIKDSLPINVKRVLYGDAGDIK